MGFVLPGLGIVFFGLLLRGWWHSGRVPTVLWFEAERSKNPAVFWPFFLLAVGAWCWFIGYVFLGVVDPATAPQLHGKDRLGVWDLALACAMVLGSGFIAWWDLKEVLKRRHLASIRLQADDLSPDEEGWGIEDAALFYSLTELKQLRQELERMPKGGRQLKEAMRRVESSWER